MFNFEDTMNLVEWLGGEDLQQCSFVSNIIQVKSMENEHKTYWWNALR
jgi:hypothetical protein